MKKKRITAEELIDQLEGDPEYQERIQRRNAELKPIWEKRKKDEMELVEEVRRCGYNIDSVYDLVNNSPHPVLDRTFIGPYERAYPILTKHLDIEHERIIREGIIRALTVKDGGKEVEEALLRHFFEEQNNDTKWILANALRTAMPYHRRKKYPEIRRFFKDKE